MKELKPCPFCGGEVSIEKNSYLTSSRYYDIYCERCDFYLIFDDLFAKEEDIIEAWNRRVKE